MSPYYEERRLARQLDEAVRNLEVFENWKEACNATTAPEDFGLRIDWRWGSSVHGYDTVRDEVLKSVQANFMQTLDGVHERLKMVVLNAREQLRDAMKRTI